MAPIHPGSRPASRPKTTLRSVPDDERAERVRRRNTAIGAAGSFLDAIPAEAAILDEEGRLLCANAAWRRFGEIAGLGASATLATARSLQDPAAFAEPIVEEVVCGIREVARGERVEFRLAYPSDETGTRIRTSFTPSDTSTARTCACSCSTRTSRS